MRRLGGGAKNVISTIVTPFTPGDLAGLTAWFRGDSLVDAGGGTANQWTDKSGNGRNATQGNGALQPTIQPAGLGGKAAATWGGTQYMTGTLLAGLNDLTIWTVVSPVPQVGRGDMFGFGAYRQVFGFLSAQLEAYNNADLVYADLVAAAATPYATQHQVDSSNNHWNAFLNSVASAQNPKVSAVATTSTNFVVGSGDTPPGNGQYVGDISEIILIDHVSTPTEDAQVHAYFQQYYGLP